MHKRDCGTNSRRGEGYVAAGAEAVQRCNRTLKR